MGTVKCPPLNGHLGGVVRKMSTAKISPVRSIAIVLSEQCRKENRSEK